MNRKELKTDAKRKKSELKKSPEGKEKGTEKEKVEKKLSIIGLFVMIIVGFVKSIPKMWKSILLRTIISFLIIMLVNVYTIALKNEGYGPSNFSFGTFWGDMMNLNENTAAYSALCFVATYLLTMIISQIFAKGIKLFFLDIAAVFPWMIDCFQKLGKKVGPLLLITMGVTMALGIATKNDLLFITLAITLFFEFVGQEKGIVGSLALASWNDYHRVFKKKQDIPDLNSHYVGILIMGLFGAMVILFLIPTNSKVLFSAILLIVFIALGVLLALNKVTNKTVKNAMLFLIFNLVIMKMTGVVRADNGGYSEAGASWGTYIGTSGSKEVILSGVKPSIFGVVGGYLASAGNGLVSAGKWGWGFTKAVASDVGYVVKETAIGINDLRKDIITNDLKIGKFELIKGTWDGSVKECKEFQKDIYEAGYKGAEWVEKNVTMENIKKLGTKATDVAEAGFDILVEEGKEFIDDPMGYAGDKYDAGIDLVEKGGEFAGELSIKAEKLITDMIEGGKDPKKVWEIIKKILPTDSIKNMIDPNSPLGVRLLNTGFAVLDAGQLIFTAGAGTVLAGGVKEGIELGIKTGVKEGIELGIKTGVKEGIELGVKTGVKEGIELGVKTGVKEGIELGAKTGVKEGIELGAKTGVKEGIETGAKTGVKEGIETGVKTGAKEGIETGVKTGAKEGIETGVKTGVKEGAETGVKTGAKEGAETGVKTGAKEGVETGVKTGAKEGVETGAKTGAKEGAEKGAKKPEFGQGDDYERLGKAGDKELGFMTKDSKVAIQKVADDMGVQVHVRPGNPESAKWLDAGDAIPKPQIIKSKTIGDLDKYIGGPDGKEGLVGYFKPKKPNLKDIPEELHGAVKKQFADRMDDYNKYSNRMIDLEQSGLVKVKDGIVHMAVKDPDTGKIIYKQVAGDVDLFDIRNFDGSEVSQTVKDMATKELKRLKASNVEHKDLISWDDIDNYKKTYGSKWESIEKEFADNSFSSTAKNNMIDKAKGAEGVVTFNPLDDATKNIYKKD